MKDIFDHTIICKKCNQVMARSECVKDGFKLRCMKCEKCGDEILHPVDEHEYEKFKGLQSKTFKVKLRLVGNSYAVSIPKEIVLFMREQERVMDDMVRLCFDQMGRLTLDFEDHINGLNNIKRVRRF